MARRKISRILGTKDFVPLTAFGVVVNSLNLSLLAVRIVSLQVKTGDQSKMYCSEQIGYWQVAGMDKLYF